MLLLTAVLRLAWLGEIPAGLSHDETVKGYDAWSVLRTGHDQYGERLPLVFRGIGDQREALLPYLIVLSEAVLGPTALAVRLPTALAGIALVGVIFLLGRELFGARVGLLAALFLACSPWAVQVSRLAFRAGLLPLTTALGLWLLLLALRRCAPSDRPDMPVALDTATPCVTPPAEPVRHIGEDARAVPRIPSTSLMLLAGIVLGLGLHTYLAARLFLPLLLLGVLLICRTELLPPRRPHAGPLRRLWSRPVVPLLTGVALIALPLALWAVRHPAEFAGHAAASAGSGSPVRQLLAALGRYAAYFGPRHLLTAGDPYPVPSTGRFGALYLPLLPLFLLGLVTLLRGPTRGGLLVLWWLAVYPVPAALTRGAHPDWLRAAAGIGVLELVAAVGALAAWTALRQGRFLTTFSSRGLPRRGGAPSLHPTPPAATPSLLSLRPRRVPMLLAGIAGALYALNVAWFLADYALRFPDRAATAFQDGSAAAVQRVAALAPAYERVILPDDVPAVHDIYLFHTRYDPRQLHAEGLEDAAPPGAWADVRGFGKHRLCRPAACCGPGDLCLARGVWTGAGEVLAVVHDRTGRVAFSIIAGR